MSNEIRLPVNADTCTILGNRYKADSAAWTGLHFNGDEELRTQSTLMRFVCGTDAPYDLHLDVPWEHPRDWDGVSEPDCIYRVRPCMEPGKRWKRRMVKAVSIERDETLMPPWAIIVEFA